MGHAPCWSTIRGPPAKAVCDVHVRASTFDADACIRAARRPGHGVFTLGTDQPVFTALVADALGCRPRSGHTARKATDKRAMKEAFRRSRCRTRRTRC